MAESAQYVSLLEQFKNDDAIIAFCRGEGGQGDMRCAQGGLADAIAARNKLDEDPEKFSWSNENARLFYGIRDWLFETFDIKGLRQVELNGMLDIFGEEFFIENQRWPTLQDVEGTDGLTDLGTTLVVDMYRRANGSDLLPETFKMMNPDGSFTVYDNSPTVGITPQARFTDGVFDPGAGAGAQIPVAPDHAETAISSRNRNRGSGTADPQGDGFGSATREEFLNRRGAGLAILTQDYIDSLRSDIDDEDDDKKGSGRGKLAFDRAQVGESIRDGWRTLMLEEPGNLSGLIDSYIGEANAFYQSEGGQKNLEAWMLGKMRQTARYGMLYGRKDTSMSEMDWLRSFDTSEFGLRAEDATAQQIRGMSSGAAPASFQQSVEQSRDVQALGQGRFSQRFANSINQLGRLQRT